MPEQPGATVEQRGSSSIGQPDYWWYRARSSLLRAALVEHLGEPARLLDVGSADGPSVGWLHGGTRICVDTDPRGLVPGRGVRASLEALPFTDASFDVVGAFDVVEHCADEARAFAEIVRVLRPGGRLLLSVPAYAWAWSDHDVRAGHHRRYTRRRLLDATRGAGLVVERCTHGFTAVFPFFAVERALRRLRPSTPAADAPLPRVPSAIDRGLMALCRMEARVLPRHDLAFGSSIFMAAYRPGP